VTDILVVPTHTPKAQNIGGPKKEYRPRRGFRWPDSLAEVVRVSVRNPELGDIDLRNFALAFYSARDSCRPGMIVEEPCLTGDAVQDAILGGIGEHFS
jgi:hypothetical protein